VPAVAVIQKAQALFIITGHKGYVGGFKKAMLKIEEKPYKKCIFLELNWS